MPPLILASASPRRAELLRQLGWEFRVLSGSVEEFTPPFLSPQETARLNARRKAHCIAGQFPESIVLGADTLVCLGPKVLGKPKDLAGARRMLRQLQGRTHQVVTGVCLVHWETGREGLFAVSTDVTFRGLHRGQIADYLTLINPFDKAGAYAIQEHGEQIIEKIDGSYSNVVGLPLERLQEVLSQWTR